METIDWRETSELEDGIGGKKEDGIGEFTHNSEHKETKKHKRDELEIKKL